MAAMQRQRREYGRWSVRAAGCPMRPALRGQRGQSSSNHNFLCTTNKKLDRPAEAPTACSIRPFDRLHTEAWAPACVQDIEFRS